MKFFSTFTLFVIAYFGAGVAIIGGLKTLNNRYGIPESCKLAGNYSVLIMEEVLHRYKTCESQLEGINLDRQSKEINAITIQVDRNGVSRYTENKVADISRSIDDQFRLQRSWYINTAIDFLVIFFFFWLFPLVLIIHLIWLIWTDYLFRK